MTWLDPVVVHLKALHIGMFAIWVAGLFTLPQMLSRHDSAIRQADYADIRRVTHYGYTFVVTPAAVLAIASGTVLIFARDVFAPWMFAKLVAVGLLVVFHAWLGYTIVAVTENERPHTPPGALALALVLAVPVVAILTLVLAKPELGEVPLPSWLTEPRGHQLPFDVPR